MAEWGELKTILLAGLVDSRRLATSVAPMRTDQPRQEHFLPLRDAIAAKT
jgi:hypothetical protein